MLGYIVKILDCPKNLNLSNRPHSVGDYGLVKEVGTCTIEVRTAHGSTIRCHKNMVEVYSRTPVDLIIKDGKSLPANKQAVDKSISQSSSGFRNSSELKNTYIRINDATDWNKALHFYNDRGYSFERTVPLYGPAFRFLCAGKLSDILFTNSLTSVVGATDITAQVLGVTGEPHQFHVGDVVQYTSGRHGRDEKTNPKNTQGIIYRVDSGPTSLHIGVDRNTGGKNSYNHSDLIFIASSKDSIVSFIPSPSITMTETQSLEQLKFNKYVEENKDDIVSLSESIDAKLEDLNDLGHTAGDFYIKVKTTSAAMSSAFSNCDKIHLDKMYHDLSAYDAIFASKEYKDLVAATKALDKKMETLASED